MVGKHAGRIRGSTALRNDKSHSCSQKRNRHCGHCRSNPSATTSTETARFIWTAVWKSRPPITAHLPAGSDAGSKCSGTACWFVSSIPKAGSCCANTYARSVAGIALKKKTTRNRDRFASPSYYGEPDERVLRAEHSATFFIASKENRVSAAS